METAISLPVAGASASRPSRLSRGPATVSLASRSSRGGRRLCRRRSLTVSAAAGVSPPVSPSPSPDAGSAAVWDALGGVSVLAAGTGDAVPLRDLWDPTEGVAVVALLRHFGCFCCWELASVLKDSMPKFDAAGAKLIAVGVGTPDKARILADRVSIYARCEIECVSVCLSVPSISLRFCAFQLPFPMDSLYADPERKAYDAN
ncbi:hypothetical protein GUJ93_ZPchr0003g17452 [Zizania palustris]|uniref:Uncharacterized protein n=1 Tax=Zizania palustris TaxID=103762 RepID=A0A8J5S865_ZIZPA|nr:hypothetical protein GUJ93_ZPchr0003g17452 [Zizania palustris]